MKRIGVDVGGTFTDLVLWDDDGTVVVHKTPSTNHDPSIGTMDGIAVLAERAGIDPAEIDMFFHGTTVATNIVLEHNGCDVGMITTEGFRDLLHIARKKRPLNYSNYQDLPWQKWQLVPRRNRRVVPERIDASGAVLTPLDEDAVREQVRLLRERGVDAIAVAFLHSYRNPTHEQRVKAIIAEEFPGVFVSLSSEVAPQYREYERFSTAALNAFIGPKTSQYIENLAQKASAAQVGEDVHLMTSAGGLVTSRSASEIPVSLLTSGVVAGLLGGCAIGKASGFPSVITLDVGGTSADVGVAPDGALRMKHLLDTRIGDYHAMVPMAEVDTIGAGGGSIAVVDDGGMFRVGPRSAGAVPGPACYGHGGTEPTSTDAMVMMGWLRENSFLSGTMRVQPELARTAIQTHIADKLDAPLDEAAMGIFKILAHSMTEAISLHSVRKGYDPRDFSLIAEGGAGPLFAWQIADQLGIPRVIVPAHPGITSAVGLLTTDIRYEEPTTVWTSSADPDIELLRQQVERLSEQAVAQLRADGVAPENISLERSVDCRYVGQGYELRVQAPDGEIDDVWVKTTAEAFHEAHGRTYSQRFDDKPVQLINVRVTGVGAVPHVRIADIEKGTADASAAIKTTARALFWKDDTAKPEWVETPVYERSLLLAGNRFDGPAIVEQFDSTTIVGMNQHATVDAVGHIIIERNLA
ncbi:hydantoinase/oxoprolinase family protein [Rhodococcus sp. BP-149]|uniref:hydantoinase/oxoprolinase family protein n=1 Tax=unclassified Rhodococcus (in: high G+C Gram-positive bacteria) TaxID=192944 RepID=UPI001C9A3BEC|nr:MULTISPECIES: hydantoinase/oxoprolinase family protein [unclassified Rhodococcus (in: high G+C Gram-positive bacteria)]MBY6687275.1 hydantoinase/oxoprolinase family protein [Rhodococcus sp. BP-288]MBY6694302.1 hydantoinase/oxoprolinase family protein [Rhodococcus sp. BP-188]MBY6698011.1 hydantoinase/oxoprolinase family protein [Rhodococcus sp. BP-285]MBY6704231.1 hydantoinase/oxoprolinase family protein [Rhodococcus sp. BP-283]MBY6712880.1 hydantoinase/oxoprolinase family protein [Rhodococc